MALPDAGSRYAGLPAIEVREQDGSTRRMLAPRVVPQPPSRGSYLVPPGARLDLLGAAAAGDSTLWWRIADANPHADATRLERPGSVIELPDA